MINFMQSVNPLPADWVPPKRLARELLEPVAYSVGGPVVYSVRACT